MPSRCIWRTCGMYWTRSHERSSVSTKTTFGRADWRCCAVRASGATDAAAIVTARSVRAASRTTDEGRDPATHPLGTCSTEHEPYETDFVAARGGSERDAVRGHCGGR